MTRAGLGSGQVGQMCHIELAAWLATVMQSMGIKQPAEEATIISRRLPKPK